jgi:methyltransferase
MGSTQIAYLGLLALVALERLFELRLSRANAAIAFARGGREFGRAHFGVMGALHAAFLVACALEVVLLDRPFEPRLAWPMLSLAVAAQGLRYWSILSLGTHWNVRVIVVPNDPVVTKGPYRWLRHPNYLAVVVEGIALPLIHGAWWTALAFTVANALLLAMRIRVEEDALGRYCAGARRLAEQPRFVPIRSAR